MICFSAVKECYSDSIEMENGLAALLQLRNVIPVNPHLNGFQCISNIYISVRCVYDAPVPLFCVYLDMLSEK